MTETLFPPEYVEARARYRAFMDEHLYPKLSEVLRIFDLYAPYFHPGKLIVMRSTLFPGTMEHLYERITRSHPGLRVAFCPERVIRS